MHRRTKRILTGLGLVLVALAVAYAILLLRSTAQLRQAYAALAADGRPLQSAEILPPKVADANNAAVLYQSAILMLKGEPAGDKSLYERLTAHFPPSWKPGRDEGIDRAGRGGECLVAYRARDAPTRLPARTRLRGQPARLQVPGDRGHERALCSSRKPGPAWKQRPAGRAGPGTWF